MDKFYLTKLTNLVDETSKSRLELVEVQFSRKPPTFGFMYLTTKIYHKHSNDYQNNNANSSGKQTSSRSTQVVVNLSVMQINDDNVANFKSLKHIDLSMFNSKEANHKTIIDFDTTKSILLDEEDDDEQYNVSQTSHHHQLQQHSINCIILTDDGSLYGVNLRSLPYLRKAKQTINSDLTSGPTSAIVRLTSDDDESKVGNFKRLSCGSFIQCKLHQSSNDLSMFIHLLAERYYCLYELTPFSTNYKLKLINEYSLPSNTRELSYLRFTKINLIKTNPQVVLLELNNSTLNVIQQSKCISNLNLNDYFDLKSTALSNLILSLEEQSSQNNESILLTFAGTKIVAQSLQITNHNHEPTKLSSLNQASSINHLQFDKDPDKLLPKDPSFELEKCWSIDISNDIKNLTNYSIETDEEDTTNNNPFRIENDKIKYGCSMPMWSTNNPLSTTLEESQRWPEYLVVTYKYHLLIYSFEQQTVMPFSVVYDSSFLKLATAFDDKSNLASSNDQLSTNNEQPKFVDVKTKPKLLHSFKLIGSHPTDILFNNILLSNANNNNLVECNFFPLLNLIVSITNNGDVFAFKLNPSFTKLELHKDNLFQQQYAKAIGGNSLLKDQMNRLEREINSLRNNIERLEEKSLSMVDNKGQESNQLSALIQTELRQSDETECLYYISMCLSNLIKVSQIIIISAVNSYILRPVSTTSCQNVHIENNIDKLDEDNNSNYTNQSILQYSGRDFIQSWAILDLEKEDPAKSRIIKLNLPLFITDKQQGFIKVFYILDNCQQKFPVRSFYHSIIKSHLASNIESTLLESFDKLNTMLHIKELQIKPLMSYQQISRDESLLADSPDTAITKLTLTGSYKRESMIFWLSELFQDSVDIRQRKLKLKSQFNHISIESSMTEDPNNQMKISSDDLIAVDLIKKHILKRATDESIKLNVSQTPSHLSVVFNQSQINEKSELKLMNLVKKTSHKSHELASREKLESVEMILDSLVSEISNINQGLPFDRLDSYIKDERVLANSLRKDLEKLVVNEE